MSAMSKRQFLGPIAFAATIVLLAAQTARYDNYLYRVALVLLLVGLVFRIESLHNKLEGKTWRKGKTLHLTDEELVHVRRAMREQPQSWELDSAFCDAFDKVKATEKGER